MERVREAFDRLRRFIPCIRGIGADTYNTLDNRLDQLARAIAAAETAQPAWSDKPPTEEGSYVWYDTHTDQYGVVPVVSMDPEEPGLSVLWENDGTDVTDHPTFLWLGPIPEPPKRGGNQC